MAWSNTWTTTDPKAPNKEEQDLVLEAKEQYKAAEQWEANARILFEYDYKFSEGDSHNNFQWDSGLVAERSGEDRPCLTINKVAQHNLLIINDAKQNKPGIRIRPVGDEASFQSAQIFQDIIYHIEYISGAENVYDSATEFQVKGGWGYWRVVTDYVNENSFDQEIYIRRVKDPRGVYLDPYINEIDGSDANFGFVFEDIPRKEFDKRYPKYANIATQSALGNASLQQPDAWLTQGTVRVAEWFKRTQKEDVLVTWKSPIPQEDMEEPIVKRVSELDDMQKVIYQQLKANKQAQALWLFKERDILTDEIMWYKIAGDRIIEKTKWLGKYIPIVRLIGSETVIDGIMDRKGHTRALINAQQMYNYNTSANIEFGALQTKSPYIAAVDAISGYEEYYKTANSINHSFLPYNAFDELGNQLPPPKRQDPPQAGTAYIQSMQIANMEMMMASGQYQAQFGEAENAKSGVAINARQRQGDRATYHFIDNQAIAIRFTGKILIDLIPKIYDTPRILKIMSREGSIKNIQIDPQAKQAYERLDDVEMDKGKIIQQIVFNPNVGMYDIQADTGPSFATRRMDAFNALMNLATAMKEQFMGIGGDLLFKVADFPEADVLAERWRRSIAPNILGDDLPPAIAQAMDEASNLIEELKARNAELEMQMKDKSADIELRQTKNDIDALRASLIEMREDYKAETQRLKDIMNTASDGHGIDPRLNPVLDQLIAGMKEIGEPDSREALKQVGTIEDDDEPPMEGAQRASDGNWYVPQGEGWARVEMQ
jgi:hypothetical protein